MTAGGGGGETAVVGLGRSGIAATRLLLRRGRPVYASDSGAGPGAAVVAELSALGAAIEVGRHDLARIREAALVVLSPGVPPDAPPVVAARDAGVPVRAEIDLGLEALAGVPYIGVTGTNGKSTTTALAGHLLRAGGLDAEMAGNIGTAVSEVALRPSAPAWLAIEFSSFQLHDCPGVDPRAGVLTNLSPDHLDRYPDLASYYGDKRLFFRNAGPASRWIRNADDPESARLMAGAAGAVSTFSLTGPADGWFDRERAELVLDGVPLLERAALPLLGDHNVANALAAALAVVRAAGVPGDRLAEGLRSFRGLPHRMEPVRTVAGVQWINDSKATNLASTEVALAALDRPFVLLLGGRHKGEPYTRLIPRLGECRAVVAYGEAGGAVARDLGGTVTVVPAGAFDEVIEAAASLAREGDAVLLSPACSSYDMFTNYEERGARFRALVEAL